MRNLDMALRASGQRGEHDADPSDYAERDCRAVAVMSGSEHWQGPWESREHAEQLLQRMRREPSTIHCRIEER